VLEQDALHHLGTDPNDARKELTRAADELRQARASGLLKAADTAIRRALTKDENATTLVGTPNSGLVRTQLAGALNLKEAALKVLGITPKAPAVNAPPLKPVPPPPASLRTKQKPKKRAAANRVAVATLVAAALQYEDVAALAGDDGAFAAEARALGRSRERLLRALAIARSDPALKDAAVQIAAALDHDDAAYGIWRRWLDECLDCELEAADGHEQNALFEVLPSARFLARVGGGPDEFATNQPAAAAVLWFTRALANQIAVVNVVTRAVNLFPIPTAGSAPEGATFGPDGSLWFVELNAGKIGRFTPGVGFEEFRLPNPQSEPEQITNGSDGNLWFTELNGNAVGRITLDGHVTEFPLPHAGSFPISIAGDATGNLYVTEGAGRIGSITTDGRWRYEVALPGDTFPTSIVVARNRLWFTEPHADAIGSLDLNGGDLRTYPIATRGAFPLTIAPAPDGRSLWFGERGANRLGRITFDGAVSARPIASPTPLDIVGVAGGPDRHVWFTGFESGVLGSITP